MRFKRGGSEEVRHIQPPMNADEHRLNHGVLIRVHRRSSAAQCSWGNGRFPERNEEPSLFHGDALGEIAGLIDVAAAAHGDVIGQQLQGHDGENRRQQFRRGRNFDDVSATLWTLSSPSVTMASTMPSRAFTSWMLDSVLS